MQAEEVFERLEAELATLEKLLAQTRTLPRWIADGYNVREEVLPGEGGTILLQVQPYYNTDKTHAIARAVCAAHNILPFLIAELRNLKSKVETP